LDHDPLFGFARWQANMRILEIEPIQTVPYVPRSHPFIKRLIGTPYSLVDGDGGACLVRGSSRHPNQRSRCRSKSHPRSANGSEVASLASRKSENGELTMPHVLVTGAAGVLGRSVMTAFRRIGVRVTRISRRALAAESGDVDWVQSDLLRSDTLFNVFRGMDVVVHCASNPREPAQDVTAIDNMLQAAKGVSHFVYVGIAGIEEAAKSFPYYRAKLACEAQLHAGCVPYSIVRATQFHPFVDLILRQLQIGPVLLLPAMKLQPVDVEFVAERLVSHALGPPQRRPPDIHGPEPLNATELAQAWRQARHVRRLTLQVPAFGILGAMARLRTATGESGGKAWQSWLSSQGSARNAYRTFTTRQR
jgi:uncharacterized protein YbjT (DUF2867 family)